MNFKNTKYFVLATFLILFFNNRSYANATSDLLKAVKLKTTTPQEIETLIKSGANVNVRDRFNNTVLMWAAAKNPNPEVIKLLIKAGADVNATVEALYMSFTGWDVLSFAARHNNIDVVKTLIDAGADVNSMSIYSGDTVLMRAINSNNPEIIKLLLSAGADPNIKNNKGHTAYDLTLNSEIKKILRNAMK